MALSIIIYAHFYAVIHVRFYTVIFVQHLHALLLQRQHLQQLDAEHLIYHSPKPRLDGSSDLVLTPLELIDKIAALVPPPRSHRHRY